MYAKYRLTRVYPGQHICYMLPLQIVMRLDARNKIFDRILYGIHIADCIIRARIVAVYWAAAITLNSIDAPSGNTLTPTASRTGNGD